MILLNEMFGEEEFNLFNPAYCGFLIFNSIREHHLQNPNGFPSSLAYIILPLIMTKAITDSFPRSSSTSFLSWVMENNDSLLNFDERATDFFEVTQEAIHFLVSNKIIDIDIDGFIRPISKSVKKSCHIFKESKTIKKQFTSSTLLGKWMVAQEATTVYSILGIRP